MVAAIKGQSKDLLRAPFPWFGGKALAAELIWSRFGTVQNYVEPFFGSGAVLLNAPDLNMTACVNDLDGFICNFWRAIKAYPEAAAAAANWPVSEIDLHARHQYLVDHRAEFTAKLKADPEWFDAKIAGWWAWGCCCWIGRGWCKERERVVWQQLPHLGNAGRGVNKSPSGVLRNIFLSEWFQHLSVKLDRTRVTCGDWERICSAGTITRFGLCSVLLDPPYGTTDAVYAMDSDTVAARVQEWCLKNGDNPLLRIALCGHAGQHEVLEAHGWTCEEWRGKGGYQGADDRERIWFSPHCVKPNKPAQLTLFG